MKKINVKSGLTGRITGAVIGGGASAIFDTYVTPMLPDSLSDSPDMVKMVAGAFIPSVMKSDLGRSLGDGLMTVGIANFIGNQLEGNSTTSSGSGTGVVGVGAPAERRINPFAAYSRRVVAGSPDRKIAGSARGC